MKNDLKNVSTEELAKELERRKVLLEENKKLSKVPIEFLISEWERRKIELEKGMLDVLKIVKSEKKIPMEIKPQVILSNAIKTPDGTFLASRHVHDFVTHTDKKTKKLYGVDGGADYLRRIGDTNECEDLVITSDTKFPEIRNRFHWGSYGKDGSGKHEYRRISELSNSHLDAILKNLSFPHGSHVKKWFECEQEFRKKLKIFVEDYK
jgi:hypothetical protein